MEAEDAVVIDGTSARLQWTALVAGFTLSTLIGGLLYTQTVQRIEHVEMTADRCQTDLRVHAETGGHAQALAMIEAHRNEVNIMAKGMADHHAVQDRRIDRLEDIIDQQRKQRGELPLFDSDPGGLARRPPYRKESQ